MEAQLYNQLLNDHTPMLRTFAYRFTRDNEEVDDLMQDTMIKAIKNYGQFKEGTNIKAWLFTILRNTFINEYRRNTRKNALITTEKEISSAHLSQSATSNAGEANFAMADIQKALASIPEHYRIPFVKYFEGYKYEEIAVELNIPIGTVKTRIHMARQILQKKLKPYRSAV
ncbi:sigma-70 family RNA polymerase sigma factor [Pedobacter frigiditerrae]|uniref:Sigma-70 family RNA polymerase sigma factor n=1 Tax=Pedobacter frigiditerrae TaxID=2530452 RepID=A0A4R0MPV4_9SPHI|nr:sigma-70 family RNA polymerase sigma factor [Pedobacter frigiditerrae]TCC88567.1 sigma-70 family RNA polymerase sigma factor [Pedobacter frigiditerrae]